MNHRNRIGRLMCCAVAAGLSLLAWGCQDGKVTNPFGDQERVKADVDLADQMRTVEASGNTHSEMGVKHMRVENWGDAAKELELAVADNGRDWRSSYALGVAYEKMGRYPEALRAYEQANLHVEGAGNPDITAGILRMKEEVD